jgi:hypothetical protein
VEVKWQSQECRITGLHLKELVKQTELNCALMIDPLIADEPLLRQSHTTNQDHRDEGRFLL